MTNAYTTRDPSNAQGMLIRTTPLESSSSNLGSNWQLFLLEAVALKRVKTRMHEHSRGQASAELGENPNRDTVHYFSRQPRQQPWPAIKMIREEWCFGREQPQNENNICGLKPFFRISTITTFVQIENSRMNEVRFQLIQPRDFYINYLNEFPQT